MKIDEVSGSPQAPQIRSQDVAAQGAEQKHSIQKVAPPDQVDLSQAARQMGRNTASRASALRSELRHTSLDAGAVAGGLLADGVLP